MKRILTALVALPILLYTVWSGIPYFFTALAALAIVIALHEFYRLARKVGCKTWDGIGYVAALGVAACFLFGKLEWIVAIVTALVVVTLAAALLRPDEIKSALVSVAASVFGVLYVALLAGFLIGVRMTQDTPHTQRLAPKLLTMFFAMV